MSPYIKYLPPPRSFWLAPFPPLFGSFNMALGFRDQKHSRAGKKRLYCRLRGTSQLYLRVARMLHGPLHSSHLRHNDSAGSHLQYWLHSAGSECRGKYHSFFEQYFKILRMKSRAPCDLFYHQFVSIGKCVLCWYQRGVAVFFFLNTYYLIKCPVLLISYLICFWRWLKFSTKVKIIDCSGMTNYSQGNRSSRPIVMSPGIEPESCCPKFIVMSHEILSHAAPNFIECIDLKKSNGGLPL